MAGRCRSHRSIRTHLKALEKAVTDPGGLATSLYQEGLIDELAWQRAEIASAAVLERSRELLQRVMVKIENDEAAFDKFVSILSEDPSMEDICRRLRTTRGIATLEKQFCYYDKILCLLQASKFNSYCNVFIQQLILVV